MEGFTDEEKRKLLKFVTSCSRPPLLGFKVHKLAAAGFKHQLVTKKPAGQQVGLSEVVRAHCFQRPALTVCQNARFIILVLCF